ncbi:MAG TPA: ABC transporter ATP-binding protein [Candidatus Thermoplasmatota archaeon]|nr:ABC transporter ATP-binding protein [Candidatus Thermoplasmatota archaeon]
MSSQGPLGDAVPGAAEGGAGGDGPLIDALDVVRQFPNGAMALRGVTFGVERGEWVTVTGRSGAGKSTLLAILGALERPTSGAVTVDGHDLSALDEKAAARYRGRTVGFVFQHYYLVPYLTVLENVALAQQLAGTVDESRCRTILEEVGLGHRVGHLPRELSGGEQQRACIARAAVNDPAVILADEPTANLDAENREAVWHLLGERHRAGATVVLVSHDAPDLPWRHHLIGLEDGRIVEDSRRGPAALPAGEPGV